MRLGGQAALRLAAAIRRPVHLAALLVVVLLVSLTRAGDAEDPGPHHGHHGTSSAEHSGHDGHDDHGSDHGAMQMATVSAESYAIGAAELARGGWRGTARASRGHPVRSALDGRTSTAWVSPRGDRRPHLLTLDLGEVQAVSGLRYVPRAGADAVRAGRIGRYAVEVSRDGRRWSAVTHGRWSTTYAPKTASFATVGARYLRLRVTNVGGTRRAVAAAELAVTGAPVGAAIDREGWVATADSAESEDPAAEAIDGDARTFWHTQYVASSPGHPHWITLDLGAATTVSALSHTPRQDGSPNGRVGGFTIAVSNDGTSFTTVAAGTWPDVATTSSIGFAPVVARFVRLTATSEAGGRGRWTSVGELHLYAPALGASLDPAGWVVTADGSAAHDPVAEAFDGDLSSFWHTPYQADITPYPHHATVDTRARYTFTGLTYTPRQDGSPNGTIGRYRIEVSDDGSTWRRVASGTWPDTREDKQVAFVPTEARWLRLVALDEAGGRGVWASAAEIGLHGSVVDPGLRGSWGPVTGLPIVPTTAVLLPGDKVLTFSAATRSTFDYTTPLTQVSILDVSTGQAGQREVSNTGHQMFCTGLSILADGRVLITGGSSAEVTTIYDPVTDTFTRGADMVLPRGYQTSVTLSNGKVFAIGGSWSGAVGGRDAELYAPDTGAWTRLSQVRATSILTDDPEGTYRADNHAWLFADSLGRVFHAGPSDQMNWFTTTGNGTTTAAGERADAPDQMNGVAVMYDAGRILATGGAPAYTGDDATAGAWTVDIRGGPGAAPVVSRVGDLSARRGFANGVVLPDGSVLVTGGMERVATFSDQTAVRTAELWNPATGQWRTLAAEANPRTYHSFSLLLADGRVLSGGGGLCGDCAVNHPDVQVLTPPYLLEADGSPRPRPAITGTVPATVRAGRVVRVSADRAVSSWVMVRVGTSTHSINSDQRRFTMPATRVGTTTSYDVTIPADRGTSVPGPYLLFALDARGTPSVGRWVRVPA